MLPSVNSPSSLVVSDLRRQRRHLGAGRGHGIASLAKLRDEVGFVLALAALRRLRQEVRSAAAHDDVGLGREELLDDAVVFGAPTGMRHHGGGRGILDLGIGDDADRHAQPCACARLVMVSTFGIVERVGRAVGIDAHGIDRRFVAGRIGADGIRRVGDDGIAAGGRDQRHMRHVVDGKLAERLAFRDALREHARRDAMRERHAVADEQDDVLRLARRRYRRRSIQVRGSARRRVTRMLVGAGLSPSETSRRIKADWSLPASRSTNVAALPKTWA